MARPSDARARLIRVSAALFRQRGYDGVGLTEILVASGAPKGSFYHHFPGGKEQLAAECISYAGEQMRLTIDRAMSEASDFKDGIRLLTSGAADWMERSGFREGCPLTSIALATTPAVADHAKAVREAFESWGERLATHAARFGASSFTPADASHLVALLEGAWIIARVRQSREPLIAAAERFLNDLDRRLEPPLKTAPASA